MPALPALHCFSEALVLHAVRILPNVFRGASSWSKIGNPLTVCTNTLCPCVLQWWETTDEAQKAYQAFWYIHTKSVGFTNVWALQWQHKRKLHGRLLIERWANNLLKFIVDHFYLEHPHLFPVMRRRSLRPQWSLLSLSHRQKQRFTLLQRYIRHSSGRQESYRVIKLSKVTGSPTFLGAWHVISTTPIL